MRGGGREGGGTSYTFSCRLSSTGAGILETRQAEGATTPSHQNWWANNGRGLRKARLTPLRPQESDGSTWQVSTQFHCKPHRKVVRRMKDQRRTPFCPLTFVLQSLFCVCVGVGGVTHTHTSPLTVFHRQVESFHFSCELSSEEAPQAWDTMPSLGEIILSDKERGKIPTAILSLGIKWHHTRDTYERTHEAKKVGNMQKNMNQPSNPLPPASCI